MPQVTLIIFINIIIYQGIILLNLTQYRLTEAHHDFFQNRLIENQTTSVHYQLNIIPLQQIASFQYYTISTSRKSLNPQTLVQNFACKNQNLQISISVTKLTAYINTYCRTATKTKVKKNQIRPVLTHQLPQFRFILSCTDYFSLGNI